MCNILVDLLKFFRIYAGTMHKRQTAQIRKEQYQSLMLDLCTCQMMVSLNIMYVGALNIKPSRPSFIPFLCTFVFTQKDNFDYH